MILEKIHQVYILLDDSIKHETDIVAPSSLFMTRGDFLLVQMASLIENGLSSVGSGTIVVYNAI